jgi:hypothetical protein
MITLKEINNTLSITSGEVQSFHPFTFDAHQDTVRIKSKGFGEVFEAVYSEYLDGNNNDEPFSSVDSLVLVLSKYSDKNFNLHSGGIEVKNSNNSDVDATGRKRISAPFGAFDNKNIMSKNDNQWEEIITGVILEHGAVTSGPFQVGDIVTGSTSNKKGTITAVGAGFITVTVKGGNSFTLTETLTGSISGATATLNTKNTGSDITFIPNESSVELKCGLAAADSAIRQTHRYISYIPGNSQLITMTYVLHALNENQEEEIGYGDDRDGLFFVRKGEDMYFVTRSYTSGVAVDTLVHQNNPLKSTDGVSVWSEDKLDGTGPSRINLVDGKIEFFFIDFLWQGAGDRRRGFKINGQTIIAHKEVNANENGTPFMSTPTLPLRYKIKNTAVQTSKPTLKEICCAVKSEGGFVLPGLKFSIGGNFQTQRATSTAKTPIFAIRLLPTFNGKPNRRVGRFLHAEFFAKGQNTLFTIEHHHDPSDITATWLPIGRGSSVEYSTDISAITGNPAHNVGDAAVAPGQAGKGGAEREDETFIDIHTYFTQNYDGDNSEIYVVYTETDTGAGTAWASMKFIESD